MKFDHEKYRQNLAFLDLLFNVMLVFVFLFIVAFLMVRPPSDKKIDPKAEALIVMTWPDHAVEDLDLWLKLPTDRYVSFKNTNTDLANIERDDRGMYGDYLQMPDGKIVRNPINKEVITLRALTPGEYVVAMHYYSGMGAVEQWTQGMTDEDKTKIKVTPYPVKIQLIKLNPSYSEVITVEFTAKTPGEEVTAFSFTIDEKGNFTNLSKDSKPFILQSAANALVQGSTSSRPWAQPWAPSAPTPAAPATGAVP